MPVLDIARLLVTFKALCAVQEIIAAMNPKSSNRGEFQEAAAIPMAMGTSDNSANRLGSAFRPSKSTVNNTVTSGMAHFDVYVNDIPIRFKLIEFAKLAINKNIAGNVNSDKTLFVWRIRSISPNNGFGCAKKPNRTEPPKRESVNNTGRGNDDLINNRLLVVARRADDNRYGESFINDDTASLAAFGLRYLRNDVVA
mmetsp:Transcript_12252/g.14039  ORF Transcript_12252/g.14039 Transcript_12252/m.14039 type:complete len:198 (-) Transcript_12252:419-1012(-)